MARKTLAKSSHHLANPPDISLDLQYMFEELNQSSGMGLTASELATITDGTFFSAFEDCSQGNCTSGTLQSAPQDSFSANEIKVICAHVGMNITRRSAGFEYVRINSLKFTLQPQPQRIPKRLKGVNDNVNSSQTGQLSVQQADLQKNDPVVRSCQDYPDCDASSAAQESEGPCYVIIIQPKRIHAILLFFNEGKLLVTRLNELLSSSNVRLSLLESKPEFHIRGRKSPQVGEKVQSLLQKILSPKVKDLANFLVWLGELPCVNSVVTVDGATALDDLSALKIGGPGDPRPRHLVNESVKAEKKRSLLPTPLLSMKISAPAHRKPRLYSQKSISTLNLQIKRTRKKSELRPIMNNSGSRDPVRAWMPIGPPRRTFAHCPNMRSYSANNFPFHQSHNRWLPQQHCQRFPPS